MSIGTFALTAALICSIIFAFVWTVPHSKIPRALARVNACVGIVSSLVLMTYTGLLLYSVGAGTILDTPLTPVLFVLSALSCGIALLFLIIGARGTTSGFSTAINRLAKADTILICLELILLTLFVVLAAYAASDGVADSPISALLTGTVAPVFWLILVGFGLVVPLIMENVRAIKLENMVIPVSLAVLSGGFALRWILVEVGLTAPL